MSKYILLGVILLYYVSLICGDSEAMIGPGKWKIFSVSYKEGKVNDVIIDVRQKKLSRTQYGYCGKVKTNVDLDSKLGVKMEVCKFVDGGCKLYQILTDNSLISFAHKFGEKNINACLELMGVNPPELPLAKGEYFVENYVLDTDKLPENCTYGRYIAESCIVNRLGTAIGCILCECEFLKLDDDSDEEEE